MAINFNEKQALLEKAIEITKAYASGGANVTTDGLAAALEKTYNKLVELKEKVNE